MTPEKEFFIYASGYVLLAVAAVVVFLISWSDKRHAANKDGAAGRSS